MAGAGQDAEAVRLDRRNFDALLAEYDRLRIRRGLGFAVNRATPTQRIDAAQVLLDLQAAGMVAPEAARDKGFWLSYLRPILAETREAGAALADAFDALRPASPDIPPVPDLVRRLLVMSAALLLAALGSYVYFFMTSPTVRGPLMVPVLETPPAPGSEPFSPPAPDDGAALRKIYSDWLERTLPAVEAPRGRRLTPRQLAERLSASSPATGSPALLLAEMLREAPMPPDRPMNGAGTEVLGVLMRYAAAAAAAEQGVSPRQFDPFLASAELERVYVGLLVPQTDKSADPPIAPSHWPLWLPFLGFLPMGPALIYALRGRAQMIAESETLARKALIARRPRPREKGARAIIDLAVDALPVPPSPSRAARDLMRMRDPIPGRRLDAPRSIRDAIDAPGAAALRYRPASVASEFVFLLRRRCDQDHERARVARLARQLRGEGVPLTVYDYTPDPRRPATAAGAPLDQRGLRDLHPRATLILCTDGEDLVDFFGGAPDPHIMAELRLWPRIALLTPTPTGEWSEREMRLSAALDAPILRATARGLEDLAGALDPMRQAAGRRARAEAASAGNVFDRVARWRDAAADSDADAIAPRPAVLRREWSSLLIDHAPSDEIRDETLSALRAFLDPAAFFWLAACGVYPRLRVDVTLWLGANLDAFGLAGAGKVFSEERFARLCALPWFAHGFMPGWLRRDAFAELTIGEAEEARSKLRRLLGETGAAGLREEAWLPRPSGAPVPHDGVMLALLDEERSETNAPDIEAKRFDERLEKARRDGWRSWAAQAAWRLATAFAWCFGAYALWPDLSAAPHANGAFLPLAAYLAASAALGLLFMIRRAARGGRT